jgi:hypothetical protein
MLANGVLRLASVSKLRMCWICLVDERGIWRVAPVEMKEAMKTLTKAGISQ